MLSAVTFSALVTAAAAAVGGSPSSMQASAAATPAATPTASPAPSAAGSNYQFPAGFNIGMVKPDELNSWCLGQRNQCPEVCKGDTSVNSCDPTTLNFSCVCGNGTAPDMSPFISSVPFYVCQATYGQCIKAHPDDAAGQRICKENAKCGTQNASATDTTLSSAHKASHTLSMATATGSGSGSDHKSSATSTAKADSSKKKNAAAVDGLTGYTTSLLAGAMFLAMRLVL